MAQKIDVNFEEIKAENEHKKLIPAVRATCTQCGHEVESFGREFASKRRCLALMREECPLGEDNYYVEEK